jgi:GntP family gluconate:H+ symporter
MAAAVLKVIGEKKSPLAMNITGFIVSIPVFCDSGFVILSTLNKALSKKTNISIVVLTIALAAGLYTTHVFVPPIFMQRQTLKLKITNMVVCLFLCCR